MQIALTLILALLAVAAVATAMRAIVIARAAAWMDMVAIGATDSCDRPDMSAARSYAPAWITCSR